MKPKTVRKLFGILLGAAVVYFLFYRCPHCGRYLDRSTGDFCPYCGKRIDP